MAEEMSMTETANVFAWAPLVLGPSPVGMVRATVIEPTALHFAPLMLPA